MKPTHYLSNLTPLRGIAAVFVIVFHTDLFLGGALLKPENSKFIMKGYLMVDFFFVLSGFIMAYVYLNQFDQKIDKISYGNFLMSRFARVYPLHLFTFAWVLIAHYSTVIFGIYKPDAISTLATITSAIPTNILLLHSMHLHNWTTWNAPSWSISVEWWMYMIFPLLALSLSKVGTLLKVAYTLVMWVGMWWIVLVLNPNNPLPLPFPSPPDYSLDVTFDFGFLRCFFGFSFGIMTYLFYKRHVGYKLLNRSYTFLFLVIGLIAGMHFAVYDTFTVILFPLILLAAAYNKGTLSNLLGWKPLQNLGNISYSVYLTHFPVFVTVNTILLFLSPATVASGPGFTTAGAWMICLLWIVLTLIVSIFTYKYIEVPARGWINRRGASTSDHPVSSPNSEIQAG